MDGDQDDGGAGTGSASWLQGPTPCGPPMSAREDASPRSSTQVLNPLTEERPFSSFRQPLALSRSSSSPESAMDDLSPRQVDVLEFITRTMEDRGFPPTYREIGDGLGISSTNGVADHVKALVKKGYLRKVGGGAARGLQLTEKCLEATGAPTLDVPILGHVAAGLPILAEENREGSLTLGRDLVPGDGPTFALRVRGESMIEEGIHDGDYVVVRQQQTARNGDMVVALVDGEATVKFFFREGKRIRLQPAHPTMAPIFVDPTQDSAIQGKVVAVFRVY